MPTTSVGDGAMLAVNVPAGSHRITLHYRPVGVCLGGVISGCSVILCVVYRVFRLRMTSKRKRSKKSKYIKYSRTISHKKIRKMFKRIKKRIRKSNNK